MDESTQEMFRYFEPLYEVIHDMPRPPEAFFRSTGESQGQQDGPSQDVPASSPAPESPRDAVPGQQHVPGPGLAPAPEALEGTQVTSDSDGDTFSDTLEQMEPEKAGQVRGLTPKSPQAGAEPPEPLSAGQGERGEGRRAEGSSSTDLPALGSNTGGCRACPCAPSCCCPPPWAGLGGGTGLSLAPAPIVGCSVAEGSHKCPVSASPGSSAPPLPIPCSGTELSEFGGCRALVPRAQLLPLVLRVWVVPRVSCAQQGRGEAGPCALEALGTAVPLTWAPPGLELCHCTLCAVPRHSRLP
ncbi:acyl-CoA-binding domain-containing protein 4 [Geospiza fortis]|uniref:Acyl-CoA-binding domain-containing protein 4 n=1 Tax=Geospiza fortis TaxID=48883 RepID=A0A8N5I3M2_GEOFO|nr:acyl-CoA-binding domain-containing protein 4 [Geospiza fortis]